jgi:DNA-binding transcriptional ArsR family regulator
MDNAFVKISDWKTAQKLSNDFSVRPIHRLLDRLVNRFCPVTRDLDIDYHWSIMQVKYATDIVFRRREELQPIYDSLIRTAIHAVKADDISTFLGRKLSPLYEGEAGNRYNIRIEGTRIRHSMGPVSIKMYDKFGQILRIETVANDVSFFKHHREVEQRDGKKVFKLAAVKKYIYSLQPDIRQLMAAANKRYLAFISTLIDPRAGVKTLDKISRPVEENGRHYRGFNFVSPEDQHLFEILSRGEFNISGLRNKDLRRYIHGKTPSQMSHILKRLRTHGLIKKIGHTYKYYLTAFERFVILAGLKLKELVLIPALCDPLQFQ